MKGLLACLRMLAYIIAYLSCLFTIRLFFFSAFKAYCFPDAICFTKNTLPKAPDPNTLIMLNDAKLTLVVAIELNYWLKLSNSAFAAFARLSGVYGSYLCSFWLWLSLLLLLWCYSGLCLVGVSCWRWFFSGSFLVVSLFTIGASWLLFENVLCRLIFTNKGLFFFGYFLVESNSTSSIIISCLLI